MTDGKRQRSHSPSTEPYNENDSGPSSRPDTNDANSNNGGNNSASASNGDLKEDTLTVRRREANRLAAQRFRSRKKGYQDSLEERIRVLEDDREGLLRQMGGAPEMTGNVDVRVAALEAANRRLRDEMSMLRADNDRLRDELEAWRRQDHRLPPMHSRTPEYHPPHQPLERTRSYPAPQSDLRLPPIRSPYDHHRSH